jgi:hypothetical protein
VDAAVPQATKDGLADGTAGDKRRSNSGRLGRPKDGAADRYWQSREDEGITLIYLWARAHLIVPAVRTILRALEVTPSLAH